MIQKKLAPIGTLMVSKMIMEEGKKPLFMYREKRVNPEDSGWRIFSGFESQEYTDDPENTGIYLPALVIAKDPSIQELLKKGVGSVFERENEQSDWYAVDDFKLEDDYLVKYKLTTFWGIEINNLFERIQEEASGDLIFTAGDKSLRMAIWNMERNTKEMIYEDTKADMAEKASLKTYDLSDEEIYRIGYLTESKVENQSMHVIHSYAIKDEQLLQLAFYIDDDKDVEWALETWRSIQGVKE